MGLDEEVRLRTFEWLKEQQAIHGDVLPRHLLEKGFEFEGERIPLIAPQGIFKPRFLELPLSITTAPKGPYADSQSNDGYLLYKYRGTDPSIAITWAFGRRCSETRHLCTFSALSQEDILPRGRSTS
jgi:hypothetical protein